MLVKLVFGLCDAVDVIDVAAAELLGVRTRIAREYFVILPRVCEAGYCGGYIGRRRHCC